MKDCCFSSEISGFESEDQYNSLMKDIDSNQNIEYLNTIPGSIEKPKWKICGLGFGSKTVWGSSMYRCKECQKTWCLSDPSFPWEGYLKLATH
jgi:hypothetical protein